ncbi:MAG TPA: TRAP transporter small permease [Chloroflexota bacterium]|nr:TRAP transporter small permease [Chloroflexota bacterium]
MVRQFYAAYRMVQRVNGVCLAVSCLLIVLIMVLMLWETVTRYFFRQPAVWTYPVTSYMLLYCIYLALGYTLQKGGHVSVDFVVEVAPPAVRRWLERLGHLLGLVCTLVFLAQTWRLFLRHALEGTRDISLLSIPMAPMSVVMPVGLALMAITYAFVLIDSFLTPPGQPTLQDAQRDAGRPIVQVE